MARVYPDSEGGDDEQEDLIPHGLEMAERPKGCICGIIVPGDDANLECPVHVVRLLREQADQYRD